jgi:hypothetical protein
MAYISNNVFTVEGVLASAVADDATFTVSYPSGTSQASFDTGLAGTGSTLILNGNDKYSLADPGFSLTFGASNITVTNLSGASWPAGTSYVLGLDQVDGNDVVVLTIPVFAMAGITAADVVTEIRPGVAGTIEHWEWVQGAPVTTASDAATLNLEIDTTNVTGGTIALTSAACTPLGKVIPCAAITGNNTLTKASKLSVEASSVTAFAEGSGYLLIRIRKAAS